MSGLRNLFLLVAIPLCTVACKKENNTTPIKKPVAQTKGGFIEKKISLGTHKLAAFSIIKNSKYLVVFESGLGNDHSIWDNNNFALNISNSIDVVTYDRAGYGDSENGPAPRNINRLQGELDSILDYFAAGRKVILVGHSLGGFIIRDCAIRHPAQIAALLFIDPSHEASSNVTQQQEDEIVSYSNSTYGGMYEAREWLEDNQYMATLPDLPDVPVTVLTSMITDATITAADRQVWYNAHELLKKGVSDFTHIGVPNSGHYIMIDQPEIVMDNLNTVISKLP